jgi:hypothetical protein
MLDPFCIRSFLYPLYLYLRTLEWMAVVCYFLGVGGVPTLCLLLIGWVEVRAVGDKVGHAPVPLEGPKCVIPVVIVLFWMAVIRVVVDVRVVAFLDLFFLYLLLSAHPHQLIKLFREKCELSPQNSYGPYCHLKRETKQMLSLNTLF